MYIDLVLVKHANSNKKYLFQAPSWSGLDKNDLVVVQTKHGKTEGKVIALCAVDNASNEFKFIVETAGATEPLQKVLAKIEHKPFNYEEEK